MVNIRRGVLYLRYSTHHQTEQSIEGQETECLKYCKANHIQVVGKYIDRNKSASKDVEKREEFQAMIRDSKSGRFDCVVVYALNRFSRDRYDSAIYKQQLKKNGVELLSATQQISSSPDGILLEALFEGLDQYYSAELAQKIKRGMNESKKKLQYVGGPVPTGLKVVNKKYVPDPDTSYMIVDLFQRYAEGATTTEIVRVYRDKGWKTNQGREFTRRSVTSLLKCEKFIGTLWETENAIEPIISKEVWEKVQLRLQRQKETRGYTRTNVDFLLRGKVYCGECGAPMIGTTGTSRNKTKHSYYNCSKKYNDNLCNKKAVRKCELEDIVVEKCSEVLNEEMMERIAKAAVKSCKEDLVDVSKEQALAQEIKGLETKINNLMKSIEAGLFNDTIVNRMNEYTELKEKLIAELDHEKENRIDLSEDVILFYLDHVKKKAYTNGKLLIELLVKRVYVYDDKRVLIEFNLDGSQDSVVEFAEIASRSTMLTSQRTRIYYKGSFFICERLNY